jgi:hypothetical protein
MNPGAGVKIPDIEMKVDNHTPAGFIPPVKLIIKFPARNHFVHDLYF